ncbi:hypothetical protein D3C86_1925370 [compost metagenome]
MALAAGAARPLATVFAAGFLAATGLATAFFAAGLADFTPSAALALDFVLGASLASDLAAFCAAFLSASRLAADGAGLAAPSFRRTGLSPQISSRR